MKIIGKTLNHMYDMYAAFDVIDMVKELRVEKV